MKNVILFLSVLLIQLNVLGQKLYFDEINQSQNKLLDKYGIDFTGAHCRYMVSTGRVNRLCDSIADSMVNAYNRFMLWNDGSFKVVPDRVVLMSGSDYLSLKPNRNEWLGMDFRETTKILSLYHKEIHQDGINSIEILEVNSYRDLVQTLIMVEDSEGRWDLFFGNDDDTDLTCPWCTTE